MTNKQTNWWDNVVLWLTGSLPKKTRDRITQEFKQTVDQFQDLTEIAKEVAVAKSTEILEDIKEEIVEQVAPKPKAAAKKTKLEQVKEDAARMQSKQTVAKTATPKKTSAGTGKVASSDVAKKPATPKKKKAE